MFYGKYQARRAHILQRSVPNTRQLYFRLSVRVAVKHGLGVVLLLLRHSGSLDQLTALREVTAKSLESDKITPKCVRFSPRTNFTKGAVFFQS
ncbi:deleted in malignant brain tumors 1 protein [Sarotherodon galilaeus]